MGFLFLTFTALLLAATVAAAKSNGAPTQLQRNWRAKRDIPTADRVDQGYRMSSFDRVGPLDAPPFRIKSLKLGWTTKSRSCRGSK